MSIFYANESLCRLIDSGLKTVEIMLSFVLVLTAVTKNMNVPCSNNLNSFVL